jgi:hypothetical protein
MTLVAVIDFAKEPDGKARQWTGMTLRVHLHDRRRPHVIVAALPWEPARARPCTAAVARLPIRHPQSSGLRRDIS